MKFERHDRPPDTKIGSVFRQHPLKSSLPSIVATRSLSVAAAWIHARQLTSAEKNGGAGQAAVQLDPIADRRGIGGGHHARHLRCGIFTAVLVDGLCSVKAEYRSLRYADTAARHDDQDERAGGKAGTVDDDALAGLPKLLEKLDKGVRLPPGLASIRTSADTGVNETRRNRTAYSPRRIGLILSPDERLFRHPKSRLRHESESVGRNHRLYPINSATSMGVVHVGGAAASATANAVTPSICPEARFLSSFRLPAGSLAMIALAAHMFKTG